MISSHSSSVKFFLPSFNSSMSTWGIWIGVSLRMWMGEAFSLLPETHIRAAQYTRYRRRATGQTLLDSPLKLGYS